VLVQQTASLSITASLPVSLQLSIPFPSGVPFPFQTGLTLDDQPPANRRTNFLAKTFTKLHGSWPNVRQQQVFT
jgi:hypothetical protein